MRDKAQSRRQWPTADIIKRAVFVEDAGRIRTVKTVTIVSHPGAILQHVAMAFQGLLWTRGGSTMFTARLLDLGLPQKLCAAANEAGSHMLPGYFDAESFDISATASCTVVMNCAGKMMVEFFSIEISAIVWRVRS